MRDEDGQERVSKREKRENGETEMGREEMMMMIEDVKKRRCREKGRRK